MDKNEKKPGEKRFTGSILRKNTPNAVKSCDFLTKLRPLLLIFALFGPFHLILGHFRPNNAHFTPFSAQISCFSSNLTQFNQKNMILRKISLQGFTPAANQISRPPSGVNQGLFFRDQFLLFRGHLILSTSRPFFI